MGQPDIDVKCEVCGAIFSREAKEVKRSLKLKRRSFCSRGCSATFRNKLPANRILRAKLNRPQIGDKNPNWKGGVSNVESVLKSRAKHPERHAARKILQRAVKKGLIKKPERCEECGKKKYITAHHEDYSKPLEVDWLCRLCHGAADTSLRKRRKAS